MPKETGPFVSELALKKAAEEALHAEFEEVTAAQKAKIDTALTAETPAEEAQDLGPKGIRTVTDPKIEGDPGRKDVSKDLYHICKDAVEGFFLMVKNWTITEEERKKKTANLPDKPDPIREGELSNVITVDSTNATSTPNPDPDTTAGTAVPTKPEESQKSSANSDRTIRIR